jgi:hypothetical protein
MRFIALTMNNFHKKSIVCIGLFSITAATCFWLHAQENVASDSTVPTDKWEQVKKNNEDMTKSMETIEQNLQFIKARSMSGGRGS